MALLRLDPKEQGTLAHGILPHMAAEQNLEMWEDRLGGSYLRFLLALSDGPIDALADTQRQTLVWLDQNLETLCEADRRPSIALYLARDESGLPMAWRLHRDNGGVVPEPEDGDATARLLGVVARDFSCALLGPLDGLSQDNRGEPETEGAGGELSEIEITELLKKHPRGVELARLLRAEAAGWGEVMMVGMGVTALSHVFGISALLSAASRRLRHQANPGATEFMCQSMACLEEVRNLIDKGTIAIPAAIGFSGLAIEGVEDVQLSIGSLRAPTPGEAEEPMLEEEVHAVLTTSVIRTLISGDLAQLAVRDDGQERLAELGRAVCLATVLSQDDGAEAQAPIIAWITDLPPVSAVSISFRPVPPAAPPRGVDNRSGEGLEALVTWVERILAADLSRIDIAVERLLRACWEPLERANALIDAVIAWENLVGTQHETTYRVTAALAVLCEKDASRRIERRKEFARIYDARSRLVHGDTLGMRDPDVHRRAIRICCDAIRRLMVDHPHLLGLSRSDDRANHLLLGVGG